jgi:hypothetical protein
LVRRDSQIRFLYEREKEFSEVVHGIVHSKMFRLYRALIWPVRKPWSWYKSRQIG